MKNDVIKMLRYNTGTDKKAFIALKDNFDAVIFNATIVAHSGSAVADLVSVYKNKYIIDPQTHMLQHNIMALMSKNKKTGRYSIKSSVSKYLRQLPSKVAEVIENENRPLRINELQDVLKELVEKVYDFEISYVTSIVEGKEYDKYLRYVKLVPSPMVIIAPYFMLKKDMEEGEKADYLELNKDSLKKIIELDSTKESTYPIAAQLVMDKEILRDNKILEIIENTYKLDGYKYIFLWIDDFSTFSCNKQDKIAFKNLIQLLNRIGKKPLMAYGGYDSILLSHSNMSSRLFGVAQSVGYGEARNITPVGGGLPVNKYYFGPLHLRMRFDEALKILMDTGYFHTGKNNYEHAKNYYSNICNCPQCQNVMKDDINNFKIYNESIPYKVGTKHGEIKRNRPTTEASLVAAMHFLYYKQREWKEVEEEHLEKLLKMLIENYQKFALDKAYNIKEWCDIFGK